MLTRADNGALAASPGRWKSHGAGAVAVLERRADGTPNRQLVSAPRGGAVHQLDLGGSHHGDALIGFLQGDGANTQIAAVVVRAPPGEFVLDTPATWGRAARIPLQWDTPLAGAGTLPYSVLVDDREVAENITSTETTLTGSEVSSGVHSIQVEATDSLGQVVDSEPSTLKVDRSPPRVSVRVRGGTVVVRVNDGPKGRGSGSTPARCMSAFGDGRSCAWARNAAASFCGGWLLHDHGHRLRQCGQPSSAFAGGWQFHESPSCAGPRNASPRVRVRARARRSGACDLRSRRGGLGAEIVSVDNASDEQGNAPTTDAVISANGQYVVLPDAIDKLL